jgi:anti-sigma regulatory factor (Ser/Thr protein kinase)
MDDAGLFSHRLTEARYPAELSSVPEARHWLVEQFEGELSPEILAVAALLTSELATNAVLHARSPFALGAGRTDLGVRVEVRDGDTTSPVMAAPPDNPRIGGWGLRIVDELASRWGVVKEPDGKRVWFELDGG